jgi:outer membrane protein assembly factor BamB
MKRSIMMVALIAQLLVSVQPLFAQDTLPAAPPADAAQGATPLEGVAQTEAAAAIDAQDWPQLGRDPQRTNSSPLRVDGPYCYAWKWYGVPFPARAQPVVAAGRLFIGGMDGVLYARNATTGAALWQFQTAGPIRHSAGVFGNVVVVSSHDGFSYGVDAASGQQVWKTATGPSATAPLIDATRGWAYVGSTNGMFMALNAQNGAKQWEVATGAPVLTSAALSADGATVFVGNEAIQAIAYNAQSGVQVWRQTLQGQSLTDRYPVVAGNTVIYRSQPLFHFHLLLLNGDEIMDQAGGVRGTIEEDWAAVRPHITKHLTDNPARQSFFALDTANGQSRGLAPMLYTYGNNDTPAPPVVDPSGVYVVYRARKGIQTDGGSTHVRTDYDAELGRMNLGSLDIAGLRQANYPTFGRELRATSDEPSVLTMGGGILWVDNWERIGNLDTVSGRLNYAGNVSNVWPECYSGTVCGPTGTNTFFPMSGGQAYPFPSPRVTEGNQRPGAVIANNMVYWRVIEGGIAALRTGPCAGTQVHTTTASTEVDNRLAPAPEGSTSIEPVMPGSLEGASPAPALVGNNRLYLPSMQRTANTFMRYIAGDLTRPNPNPPADLVARLRGEVQAMLALANGQHLLPVYIERGFSRPQVWPYQTTPNACGSNPGPCLASISYNNTGNFGNVFWFDPGELMYSLAMAYPYLDANLQNQVKAYMAAEMQRFPTLRRLPYTDPARFNNSPTDWLRVGVQRETYQVPFRTQINNWPPTDIPFQTLYAVWLWSRNTGDYTYACSAWGDAKSLFESRRNTIRYYADIAGAIGYARLAQDLRSRGCANVTGADYDAGVIAASQAMANLGGVTGFEGRRQQSEKDYLDPRDIVSGWSVPVFYGITPEVGLFLREQTGSAARNYLIGKQSGDGVRWWYLTRVGVHAEDGETSYLKPTTGWAHFLGRAYVIGDRQGTLREFLDRPWVTGDLYSLQRLVMTIQAPQ